VIIDEDVEQLYQSLLARWNDQDDAGYAGLFTDEGSIVGFDGSSVESAGAIADHLNAIFADHQTATYVAVVREVRQLAPTIALLRGVQSDQGWQATHFQNTPATFDGRPDAADALRALLPVRR
jgi:uncharacterized protein (TIGR02246 family)